MTYASKREEDLIWIVLASVWAAGGLIAWCVSWIGSSEPVEGSTLAFLALVVAAIGVALRLPVITGTPHQDKFYDQIVFLLGAAATFNWVGCLLLHSQTLQDAIPTLLVVGFAEFWITRSCAFQECCPWQSDVGAIASSVVRDVLSSGRQVDRTKESLASGFLQNPDSTAQPVEGGLAMHPPDSAEMTRDSVSSSQGDTVSRRLVDGHDDEGRRYMSGDVKFTLDVGQTSEEIVIGFCPAFSQEPETDFELDHEQLDARLVNCTPVGMRVAVRRIGGSSRSTMPVAAQLQWYAVQLAPTQLTSSHESVLP